ncbi:MAG: hypothetical protein WC538_12265 [Thermoanaerobaculia bacterium]
MSGENRQGGLHSIRGMNREELNAFATANLASIGEDEAVAVLSNRFCTPPVCAAIAANSRLASYYDVKLRLVTCRATPQHLALKFVRHLYWSDLLRFSTDVQVAPTIRIAIDAQLLSALPRLTLGEKISTAKSCSRDVGKALAGDADLRVFAALLNNARLREDDLVAFLQSDRATAEHVTMVAAHGKWGFRYSVRRALASSPVAPRAIAASQLRYLRREDRDALSRNPATSVYIRRCIESLEGEGRREKVSAETDDSAPEGIGYNGGSNE